MEPRDDENREPQKAPEPRQEEPKLKRFRIVKLEERIAPRSGLIETHGCGNQCTEPETGCYCGGKL